MILAEDLTEEQQKEFIIKDNVGFGEWDMKMLADDWDRTKLNEWGMELDWNTEEVQAEEDDFEIPEEITTKIVY